MRENCTSGSVRGASGNRGSYRKRRFEPEPWRVYSKIIYMAHFMRTIKFTSWQDGEFYIGFLNDYPDYSTQGLDREDLIENLKSLLIDLESNEIPYARKVEELLVA